MSKEQYKSVAELFSDEAIKECIKEGSSAYDSGNIYRALECFNDALTFDPSHIDAHFLIWRIYIKLGFLEKAEEHFQTICNQKNSETPEYYDLHVSLGEYYKQSNNYKNAILAFKKANNIYPNNINITYKLIISYVAIGELDNSITELNHINDIISLKKRSTMTEDFIVDLKKLLDMLARCNKILLENCKSLLQNAEDVTTKEKFEQLLVFLYHTYTTTDYTREVLSSQDEQACLSYREHDSNRKSVIIDKGDNDKNQLKQAIQKVIPFDIIGYEIFLELSGDHIVDQVLA